MVLTDNLKKSNILIRATSKNRWDLIDELVELSVRNRDIPEEDRETIKKALVEREKSMSTGIGNGVAIPHCTTSKVDEMIILMAISHDGIDFDSIDGTPVKIVICLIVPKNKLTQHIKTLANIAKMMGDKDLREKILTFKTADSIVKTMKNYRNSLG